MLGGAIKPLDPMMLFDPFEAYSPRNAHYHMLPYQSFHYY